MATYTLEQKQDIIIKNPNKALLQEANNQRKNLMLQINGSGLNSAITQCEYHENPKVFTERKASAVSNKDLFKRLLGDEDQVFTARGGSAIYNLKDKKKEEEMSARMADVRYGMSLHKWMQNMAIKAYRADPMGVILIETEAIKDAEGVTPTTPKAYPTYKCSDDIHDYDPNGRRLEYICFKLTKEQQAELGIISPSAIGNLPATNIPMPVDTAEYYRFIDDASDTIYKREADAIVLATLSEGLSAELPNKWGKVPGFIISDLMRFDKPKCFESPVSVIMELANVFLRDRSIRDLQKLYFGFAKAFEPLLPCPACTLPGSEKGEGLLGGKPCPSCTPAGYDVGIGWKIDTKLGDIAKFPLGIFKELSHLKVADLYGYVTPDIEGWNKQDTSLEQLEALMNATYWNMSTTQISGYNGQQDTGETATKTLTNLQPKYARLNTTADWAEGTERWIADLLGEYYYGAAYKGSGINYSRDYILETADDVFDQYQKMISGGSPDSALNSQFIKYLKCLYQADPLAQAKAIKLFEVEPFPHRKVSDVESSSIIPLTDKLAKVYFGEWEDTLDEDYISLTDAKKLRTDLAKYVKDKTDEVNKETDDNMAKQAKYNKQGTVNS